MTDSSNLPTWMVQDKEVRARLGLDAPVWEPTAADRQALRRALGGAGAAIGRAGRRLAGQFPTPPLPYTIPPSRWSRFRSFMRGHVRCGWHWGSWKIGAAFARHSVSISLLCFQVWVTTYRTVHPDEW